MSGWMPTMFITRVRLQASTWSAISEATRGSVFIKKCVAFIRALIVPKGCATVGAHHLSRWLTALGHDARLMPAKYVRPYSKGQKNDFRDAEAIAEAVQRPTMKFVATKTADQLDLQALHRVRERLVSQRTGIINQIRAFPLERGVAVANGVHARGVSFHSQSVCALP